MTEVQLVIDAVLVHRLIAVQFPQWSNLTVRPVVRSGWDNRTFYLGKNMLVRMPSGADYASQVEKEQLWLPKIAPFLPLPIPEPLAMGEPADSYPWHWSIYRWLPGESAASAHIEDLCDFAKDLAQFLVALQQIDTKGAPLAGEHSFYRGGILKIYDAETREAIATMKNPIAFSIISD